MNRVWLVALAAALSLGCGKAVVEQAEAPSIEIETTEVAFNSAGAPTVAFEAPGMHCAMCAKGVCKTLKEQPGVVDVKADAQTKVVTVAIEQETFEPQTVIDAIAEANFGEAVMVEEEAAEETAVEEAS